MADKAAEDYTPTENDLAREQLSNQIASEAEIEQKQQFQDLLEEDSDLAAALSDKDRTLLGVEEEILPEEPITYDVKIDGVESQVSLDELTSNFQKMGHADNQMREANIAQQKLDLDRQTFEQEQQQWREKQEGLQEKPKTDNISSISIEDVDSLATAFDDLNVGSEEERIKAAETILAMTKGRGNDQPPTPQTDSSQLVTEAVQQVTRQMQYDNAAVDFAKDHKEINENPVLKDLAMQYMNEEASTSSTYEEAFQKAGVRVNQFVSSMTGKDNTPNRQESKQKLGNDPIAATRTARKERIVPQTSIDVIQEMRKSRGQSS